jgi:hypothetical protein
MERWSPRPMATNSGMNVPKSPQLPILDFMHVRVVSDRETKMSVSGREACSKIVKAQEGAPQTCTAVSKAYRRSPPATGARAAVGRAPRILSQSSHRRRRRRKTTTATSGATGGTRPPALRHLRRRPRLVGQRLEDPILLLPRSRLPPFGRGRTGTDLVASPTGADRPPGLPATPAWKRFLSTGAESSLSRARQSLRPASGDALGSHE